MSDFTDDQLTERYLELRNFLEAETEKQRAFEEPYRVGMTAIEGELHRRLLERNPNWQPGEKASGSTKFGTFFLKTSTSVKVADRAAFFEFLMAIPQRITSFATAHVAKEAVEEYVAQHKSPPPGVSIERFAQLQVRKT